MDRKTEDHGSSAKHATFTQPFFSTQVASASYFHQTLTPSEHDDLVVVCGGRERCLPDYAVRRDDFRYCSIEFVVSGRGDLFLGATRHALRPGVAFCYGPGKPHAITADRDAPMVKLFVDFAGTGAAGLLAGSVFAQAPVRTREPVRIAETFADIERSANRGTRESKDICALLLRALCLRIAEQAIPEAETARDGAVQTYRRCLAVIDGQYMQLTTLADIGRACHVAPEHVCRLFRRFEGTSPMRYLGKLKMKQAANRLQDPSALVRQVAADFGYADPFHFSRAFKRVHGLSPRQFRALAARQRPYRQ